MLVRVTYRGSAVSYRTSGYHFKQGKVEHLDTIADSLLLQEITGRSDFLIEGLPLPKEEKKEEKKEDPKVELEPSFEIEPLDTPKKKKGRK